MAAEIGEDTCGLEDLNYVLRRDGNKSDHTGIPKSQ